MVPIVKPTKAIIHQSVSELAVKLSPSAIFEASCGAKYGRSGDTADSALLAGDGRNQ